MTLSTVVFTPFPPDYTSCTLLYSIYENVLSHSFAPKITLLPRICDISSILIENIDTNVLDKSQYIKKFSTQIDQNIANADYKQ